VTHICLNVVQAHNRFGDECLVVVETGLDSHIAVQDLGRHHLGFGCRLDCRLPGVGGVGTHESHLKEPLLHDAALEEHLLVQAKVLHRLDGAEVDLPGNGTHVEYFHRHSGLMLLVRCREVLVLLPDYFSAVGIPQNHIVDLESLLDPVPGTLVVGAHRWPWRLQVGQSGALPGGSAYAFTYTFGQKINYVYF